jgi:hypothetical protein
MRIFNQTDKGVKKWLFAKSERSGAKVVVCAWLLVQKT